MSADIIGTPVERVIPEGWHVVRCAEPDDGDAMEANGKWVELEYDESKEKTDVHGRLWGKNLVIRRNAPVEPSVESLKAEVARLEADNRSLADRCRDRLIANSSKDDKILDLEEEVEALKAEVETRGKLAETLRKEATSFKAALVQMDRTVQLRLDGLKAEISEFRKELETP